MSEQKRQPKRQRQPKANTAYELLERVCAAIKAKPSAYFQQCAHVPAENRAVWGLDGCGFAYCRAGWVVVLHDGADRGSLGGLMTRADEILGFRGLETLNLFDAVDVSGAPGTPAYIREGVRGIRVFMRKHAAHLKARSLKGV